MVIGLAKNDHHKTSVIINQDLEEIELPRTSNLFLFLSNIQEEVHNYAINYHRQIKSKGTLASVLEMIPGIGVKRQKELLKAFHSLKKIQEASLEELQKYVPLEVALNIQEYFKNKEENL